MKHVKDMKCMTHVGMLISPSLSLSWNPVEMDSFWWFRYWQVDWNRVYRRESGAAVRVHGCPLSINMIGFVAKLERDAGYWIHLSRVYWPFSLSHSSRRCSAWIAFEVFGIWQLCKSFQTPWPWGHSHAFPTSLQWNLRQSLETATHLGQIEVINCSYSLYLPIQWIIDTIHLTRMHTPNVYIYIYTRIYIHIYIYIYVYTHYVYTLCIHTYIHACMHACIHTYIHTYINTLCIYIYIDIRMSTHSTVRIYMPAYIDFHHLQDSLVILGTHVFDYNIILCIYIYTYIYRYTHTQTSLDVCTWHEFTADL